jgi:hypothetical protein
MTLDLTPFCGKDDIRTTLHSPWTSNGWTYATNGHMCVRVPALESVTRSDGPNIEVVWAKLLPCDTYSPLPEVKIAPDLLKSGPCEDCGGSGVAECCTCGQDRECPTCDGGSLDDEPELWKVEVADGLFFKARYYQLLRALPGLVCDLRPDATARGRHFKFDGGEGIIMPMIERESLRQYTIRLKPTEAA